MFLLDLLAKYGPYAFVLMGGWFSAALVVAAWRVRHFRSRKIVLSLLGNALYFMWWPIFFELMGIPRMFHSMSGLLQLLMYFSLGLCMLLPVSYAAHNQRRTLPAWRAAGYRYLIDVLFFRRPYTTGPVEAAPPTEEERRIGRLTFWLILDLAVLGLVIIFLGNSLQPCAWLDLYTGRSGCERTWSFDYGTTDSLAFSGEVAVIAASDWNGPINVYQLTDGAKINQMPERGDSCSNGMSFSPDGKRMAALSKESEVMIREAATGALLHSWIVPEADGVAFSPDGTRLAVSTPKSGIQLWRTADWTLEKTLRGGSEPMAFSADGRLLATWGVSGTTVVWNVAEDFVQQTLPQSPSRGVALSPDGRYVAMAGYGDPVTIWDVATGTLSQTIPVYATSNPAFSPDGKFLAAGYRYQSGIRYSYNAALWRLVDSQQIMEISEGFSVSCVAFSPVENKFAYGSWEVMKLFHIPERVQ